MQILGKTYEGLIVLLTLAATVGFGLGSVRFPLGRTPGEFFLGNRSMGAWAIGLTLFAGISWNLVPLGVSASTIPGAASVLVAAFALGVLLLGLVVGRFAKGEAFYTVPGMLGTKIGEKAGMAVGISYVLVYLFVRIPLSILLGTRLLALTAGWEPLSTGLLMVVLPGLLAIAGGFRAVIAAQKIQAIVVIIGVGAMVVSQVSLSTVVGVFMQGDVAISWTAFTAAALILGIWHGCLDQSSAQRAFAAKSSSSAKRGTTIAAIFLVLGVGALLLGGRLETAEMPIDLSHSSVVRGILGATILALAMASLSADFMSVSTVVTMDLFRRFRSGVDDAGLTLIGRIVITFVVIVSILAASTLLLAESTFVMTTVHVTMVLASPIVAVSILGLTWPKTGGLAAAIALVVGWLLGVAALLMTIEPGVGLNTSLMLFLGLFGVVMILSVVLSLVLPRRQFGAIGSQL
ncbi:MAG: hypothetical protein WB699_12200 [Bacteroidota bacterium]